MSKRFLDAFFKHCRGNSYTQMCKYDPETFDLSVFDLDDIELKNPLFTQKIPCVINRYSYHKEDDYLDTHSFLKIISKMEFEIIKKIGNHYEETGNRWIVDANRLSKSMMPYFVNGVKQAYDANYGNFTLMNKTLSLEENSNIFRGLKQTLYSEWLPKVS